MVKKFEEKGRHRFYRNLLHSTNHSGIRGLLIHAVKDEVDTALKVSVGGGCQMGSLKLHLNMLLHIVENLMTAFLQGTVDLIPMCPLFRGSTVLQGTVDLIPMCPLFRGSTVLQGTV